MVENANGIRYEYESNLESGSEQNRADNSGAVILFLHGWGGDLRSFAGAYSEVCGWGMRAVNFAFPSVVPPQWGVYDYAAFVHGFLKAKGIDKPVIVGHSFGGRVGIILASQGVCSKLVLVDSAGARPKFSLSKKIKIARYKRCVKLGKPLDGFGSIDYNNAGREMRGVFVRIVNTHLDKLLPYIQCPTLVFWGSRDKDTPPYMARRIARKVRNCELVMTDGGHYSYIDCKYKFLRSLKSFVTDDSSGRSSTDKLFAR